MGLFKNSKFHKGKPRQEEIKEDNFHLYFREVGKHKPEPDDVIVRFRQHMDFGESDLKEEVVRCLAEVDGGVRNAVRMLMDYGAAPKEEALRICREIISDLHCTRKKRKIDIQAVIKRPFRYTVDMYYYTKPQYVPKEKGWSVVSELPNNLQ